MPESLSNPFRESPKDLNPNDEEFFEKFVPDYKPDKSAQTDQVKEEPQLEPENIQPELLSSPEEIERHEQELVTCANIEITRKQERQIQTILKKLNQERQQNGLEKVELGKEINLHKVTIGGMTKEQLEQALKQKDNKTSDGAQSMLNNPDFTTQEHQEQNILIELSVSDLGFPQGATTEEIFNKAQELGMDFCPAETGPQFRLQYQDQPMNDWVGIGMKAVRGADSRLYIFYVEHGENGLWLDKYYGNPVGPWDSAFRFVFRLSKRPLDT